MKSTIKIIAAAIVLPFLGMGQTNNGSIKGKVLDPNGTPLPFVNVYLEVGENPRGMTTDLDGKFYMLEIPTGNYNLRFSHTGYRSHYSTGVIVKPDEITLLKSITLSDNDTLKAVVIVAEEPIINMDNPSRMTKSFTVLKHSPNLRDPGLLIQGFSPEIKTNEEGTELYFRGSRKDASLYFVDGIKTDSPGIIPGVAIGSMTVYTGGIPAKYGDVTGGVVIMESKSYFDLYAIWKASTF